ncbi:unnamed protein product [Polarella glacialis]|uniref:Uncharacterized protein n=1 Tax=Polarella glacialis TaxID=89957 RepID=A0A813E4A3_POLGL|nr:unnamed protein product [Polarella glacialis]
MCQNQLADSRLNCQELYRLATASCSLSHAVKNLGIRGYELLVWGYDAIFFRRDLQPLFAAQMKQQYPLDEFECYRTGFCIRCFCCCFCVAGLGFVCCCFVICFILSSVVSP